MTDGEPVPRRAARLIVVDPRDRVLLFLTYDTRLGDPWLWFTPGGALEKGETWEEAARRELWEETGIETPLGPWVWSRTHRYRLDGRSMEARERFFLVRVGAATVRPQSLGAFERRVLVEHRWWSVPEIEAAREQVFVPHRAAELLAPLLAGEVPASPIAIGR